MKMVIQDITTYFNYVFLGAKAPLQISRVSLSVSPSVSLSVTNQKVWAMLYLVSFIFSVTPMMMTMMKMMTIMTMMTMDKWQKVTIDKKWQVT